MNNREKLDKMLDNLPDDFQVPVWHPTEWESAVISGIPGPVMVMSPDFGGMTMVAMWVKSSRIQKISVEDMKDMVCGSDGRTQN